MQGGDFTEKDHTFAVCAYKESPFLEQCIKSLLSQQVLGNIIISTSTPNRHINGIAEKYNLELRVNPAPPCIAGDWNFAYKQAKTRLITLAHQDDIYLPEYLSTALEKINKASEPLIFFSHYAVMINNEVIYKNLRLSVRKAMLAPLKAFQNSRFIRRRLLSLGNIICCPSVMFIGIDDIGFSGELKFCLDWQKWEELSKHRGGFIYSDKPLLYHRLHTGGETSKAILSGNRQQEDYLMFQKFWVKPIAYVLTKIYSNKEDSAHGSQ